MWPALWRPCRSSRIAASSSRSSTACEYTPHPSPLLPFLGDSCDWKAWAGLPVWSQRQGHASLLFRSPCLSVGEVLLSSHPEASSCLCRRACKSPCFQCVSGASSGAGWPLVSRVFHTLFLGLFSQKLSWQPVGPGKRKGKLLLLREISST